MSSMTSTTGKLWRIRLKPGLEFGSVPMYWDENFDGWTGTGTVYPDTDFHKNPDGFWEKYDG